MRGCFHMLQVLDTTLSSPSGITFTLPLGSYTPDAPHLVMSSRLFALMLLAPVYIRVNVGPACRSIICWPWRTSGSRAVARFLDGGGVDDLAPTMAPSCGRKLCRSDAR